MSKVIRVFTNASTSYIVTDDRDCRMGYCVAKIDGKKHIVAAGLNKRGAIQLANSLAKLHSC